MITIIYWIMVLVTFVVGFVFTILHDNWAHTRAHTAPLIQDFPNFGFFVIFLALCSLVWPVTVTSIILFCIYCAATNSTNDTVVSMYEFYKNNSRKS